MKVFLALFCLAVAGPMAAGQAPETKAKPPAAAEAAQDEDADLSRALGEAGSSPIEFIRVLENHLARYPNSKRRDEVERALAKAAVETKDDRRILLYGERVLARDGDDVQLLDRVARALLAAPKVDAAAAGRALDYARRSQKLVVPMRARKPSDRISQARWNDEVDSALCRAMILESRATGALGKHTEAANLATRSFEVFPNAEAAREAARWLAAAGKPADAVEWLATAFAIPDSRATDAERAADRTRMGELYLRSKGSEQGLGDLVLAAYDRSARLLAARQARLKAADPNAGVTELMDFTLTGLAGDKLPLGTLRGKTIVFDFWATWCGPCRAQHPLYEEVKRRFKDRPEVVFLSVSTDEERSRVAPFLKASNWSKKVYFEDGISKTLAISSIPTTVIVNHRGEVVSRLNGFLPDRFVDMLTQRIKEALND